MSFIPRRGQILGCATVLACALAGYAQAYTENFDSYATNSTIMGQGGWDGWDGAAAANSTVVSGGLSAPNRIRITGTSDTIHTYSGYTSGKWVYRVKQFVPSTSVGDTYFILLNRYAHGGPYSWSVQLRCNASQNVIQSDLRSATGPSLPLVEDAWAEIRCEIDITANTVSIYYNNQLLESNAWKVATDANAQNALACVDLYSAGVNSVAYYDDIRLDPGGPILSFGNYHTRVNGAVVETQGSGADRRLPVRNLGSSGEDGVSIQLNAQAGGSCVAFDPIPGSTPSGAQMAVKLNGLPPGEPVIGTLCTVRFDKATPKLFMYCAQGRHYAEFTVEAYADDVLVGSSGGGAGGLIGDCLQWPKWMESRDKRECRNQPGGGHHAIFVPNEDGPDLGDVWIGLGSIDNPMDGLQPVTLPNGVTVMATTLRLVSTNPTNESAMSTTSAVVTGNALLNSFTVKGEMNYAFGIQCMALGDNTVMTTDSGAAGDFLQVSNLGSSGQDGVSLNFCPGNGANAAWDEPDAPTIDGTSIKMQSYGVLNGSPHSLGTAECRWRPSFFDVFADFSDIGAGAMRVQLLLNGTILLDQPGVPNGIVGSAGRWPRCGGKLGRPLPCFFWWWGNGGGTTTFLFNGSVYVVDEVRMLASPPPGTQADDIYALNFTTRHLTNVKFVVADARSYGLVKVHVNLQGCPDPTGKEVTVSVRSASTHEVLETHVVTLDGNGEGSFRWDWKRFSDAFIELHMGLIRPFLSQRTPPKTRKDMLQWYMDMLTGDIDGDNEVAIGDYALLSSAYGSFEGEPNFDTYADLDCDGEIAIGDYALLSQNYGLFGDD